MFYMGGLIRTLDAELEVGGNQRLTGIRERVWERLQKYSDYLSREYNVVAHPIRNLVGMSLGSLLHSAMYARSKELWY